MRLMVPVLTAALFWSASVFSETPEIMVPGLSGNDLFRVCSDDHHFNEAYCRGYVVGVMDMVMTMNALKAIGDAVPSTCPPKEGLAPDQARDIMVQWLTAHPATRHNAATHEALVALQAAFPCK